MNVYTSKVYCVISVFMHSFGVEISMHALTRCDAPTIQYEQQQAPRLLSAIGYRLSG